MIATSNVNENDGHVATTTNSTTTTNTSAVITGSATPSFFRDGIVRPWLAAEADRVKSLPKWSELTHHDVECGRCGCNCADGECGGIPINTDFRWEKKDQEV